MEWTAWNNGSHNKTGAGYGLKVPITDRDKHFKRVWGTVTLELPISKGYKKVCVNIDKDSFWSDRCRELISKEIASGFNLKDLHHGPKNHLQSLR